MTLGTTVNIKIFQVHKNSTFRKDGHRHEYTNSYMSILRKKEAKEGVGEILLKNKKRNNGRETLEQKLL